MLSRLRFGHALQQRGPLQAVLCLRLSHLCARCLMCVVRSALSLRNAAARCAHLSRGLSQLLLQALRFSFLHL